MSAGTTTHCGVNEYCCPIARTVTEPSASTALPRLLSTNSPDRCSVLRIGGFDMALRHRRLMDADEGRHADQHADDHDRQHRPAPLDAGGDRFADAVIRLASRHASARSAAGRRTDRTQTTARSRSRSRCRRPRSRRPGRSGRWRRRASSSEPSVDACGGDELIMTRLSSALPRAVHWPAAPRPARRDCPRTCGCRSRRPRPRRRTADARTAACRRASDCRRCPADSRR